MKIAASTLESEASASNVKPPETKIRLPVPVMVGLAVMSLITV